jgi:hypothetical protein
MSDKKISQLTSASTPLGGTEELAIVQSGSTVKATAQDIADLGGGLPYKVIIANISQSGTSNPVVTEILNTYGTPLTYTRQSAGRYNSNLFDISEYDFSSYAQVFINNIKFNPVSGDVEGISAAPGGPPGQTSVTITTKTISTSTNVDNVLNVTSIEIRFFSPL